MSEAKVTEPEMKNDNEEINKNADIGNDPNMPFIFFNSPRMQKAWKTTKKPWFPWVMIVLFLFVTWCVIWMASSHHVYDPYSQALSGEESDYSLYETNDNSGYEYIITKPPLLSPTGFLTVKNPGNSCNLIVKSSIFGGYKYQVEMWDSIIGTDANSTSEVAYIVDVDSEGNVIPIEDPTDEEKKILAFYGRNVNEIAVLFEKLNSMWELK